MTRASPNPSPDRRPERPRLDRVDRDAIEPAHFKGWIEWARERGLKLDFNATCFNHPLAASGFTLSHRDKEVRRFWVEHIKRSRRIAARGRKTSWSRNST